MGVLAEIFATGEATDGMSVDYLIVANTTKHGNHDQSTHGRGRGGRKPSGGKPPKKPQQAPQAPQQAISQQGTSPAYDPNDPNSGLEHIFDSDEMDGGRPPRWYNLSRDEYPDDKLMQVIREDGTENEYRGYVHRALMDQGHTAQSAALVMKAAEAQEDPKFFDRTRQRIRDLDRATTIKRTDGTRKMVDFVDLEEMAVKIESKRWKGSDVADTAERAHKVPKKLGNAVRKNKAARKALASTKTPDKLKVRELFGKIGQRVAKAMPDREQVGDAAHTAAGAADKIAAKLLPWAMEQVTTFFGLAKSGGDSDSQKSWVD